MATPEVEVTYSCGCGYKTSSLEAALKHSREKLHCMTVFGEIRIEKPKKEEWRR